MALIDVIKYAGKRDVLAWRYPSQELRLGTQVIVNESQEAVFVKEGKILDILGPGRYTLSTENIPILAKLINLPFGGKTPFTAEIWYINKAYLLDVKWGTPTPMQLQDPKYKVFIPVRAFGQFGFQIKDSKQFLTKIVGVLDIFAQEEIVKYFRGLIVARAKDTISTYLVQKQISILEINAYINDISDELKQSINPEMEEYGITVANFFVTSIDAPEEDSAVKKLKDALAKRAEMDIVGYNYTQERSFDTLEGAAKNEGGASNLMGAGIGLGMGVGMGGTFAGQMGGITQNINTQPLTQNEKTQKCPHCGANIEGDQKFCSNCGKKVTITCAKCGSPLKKGQKFCPECGASQVLKCKKCGTEIEANQKFCPNCGEKIEEV